jgi:aspartate ammonia-lyase
MDMRLEQDSLGEVAVASDALYGAQTARAIANFPLDGQRRLGDHPALVRGLVAVKIAAARTNADIGAIDASIGDAIEAGAAKLADYDLHEVFPIHHLHGGGGTSANMNANEVLANLAEEHLGGRRGEYQRVDPLDHVNRNQSTNDVYPTALHLAVLDAWSTLEPDLGRLVSSLDSCIERFGDEPRLARTCLVDAVATTFEDLFGGYRGALERGAGRVANAVGELKAVPLGGTIVGRRSDVPPEYLDRILHHLSEASSVEGLHHPVDFFDAAQNIDDLVAVSSALSLLAGTVSKISRDLRLLASGPEGGIGELHLPAMQPGSSAMPFKVNPVIPEFAMQLCWKVGANHHLATMGHELAELDLNVWESAVGLPILESMQLLGTAATTLATRCLEGLEPDVERNRRNATSLIPLVTDLKRSHGYRSIDELVRQSGGDVSKLRGLLDEHYPAWRSDIGS